MPRKPAGKKAKKPVPKKPPAKKQPRPEPSESFDSASSTGESTAPEIDQPPPQKVARLAVSPEAENLSTKQILVSTLSFLLDQHKQKPSVSGCQKEQTTSSPAAPLIQAYGSLSSAPVDELIKVPAVILEAVRDLHDPASKSAKVDAILSAVSDAYLRPSGITGETFQRFQTDHFVFLRRILSIALAAYH